MIYIKDMDMPVDCLGCRISCKHESYRVPGRPEDCPLEEAKTGDIIRRADAIEAVRKELVCDGRHETHDKTCRFIADVLLSALPSAEAVQGEWIGYNADKEDWLRTDGTPIFLVCDKCHGTVINNGSAHWNYCPNCGARMKGGEGE